MMVRVDETRHDDHARGINHLSIRFEIRLDRNDLFAFDQHVRVFEVADIAVKSEHDAAFEQGAVASAASNHTLGLAADSSRNESHGARFHKLATRCALFMHGVSLDVGWRNAAS